MNAISYMSAWAMTVGVVSAQGGSFPITGTGTPEISIAVAWDGARFLAGVQSNATPQSAVVARFVETSGQLGPLVMMSSGGGSPRIAFGGGQYLVVWSDHSTWPDSNIFGMFVQPDGSHSASFPISVDASAKDVTGISFAGDKFLVPYTRGNSLLARRVSLTGFVGPELTLTNSRYDALSANNAGSDGTSYLVAWVDDTSRHEVRARVVFTAGLPGPEFTVNASPEASAELVAVGGTSSGYLVVFADEVGVAGSGEWDLFAQAVSATGAAVGPAHVVCNGPSKQWVPFLVSDGTKYLVTWTDLRWDANQNWQCEPGERTCWDIYGRYLAFDGAPLGPEWPIIERSDDQFVSPMAFGGDKYLMSWTDGSLNQDGGDVYGLFLPQRPFATPYCTPKVNSLGCVPALSISGVPSATGSDPFELRAANVLNNKAGIFFYSLSGRDNLPFMGGTLCGLSPLHRTFTQSSGGNPPPNDCSGVYSIDFNAWIRSGTDPLLRAGQTVWGQFWSRDPMDSATVGLTAAIEFRVGP